MTVDQPAHGGDEVFIVDPGHELAAVPGAAAKAATYQSDQRVEHSTRIRAQRHRRPERHLSRSRRNGFIERLFPCPCDVDAEPPSTRRGGFRPAEPTGRFIVRLIVSMRINRCGTGL